MAEQPQAKQAAVETVETIEKPDFQAMQRLVDQPHRGLKLTTIPEMERFAKIAIRSRWCPKDMQTVEDCFLAIQYGAERGLPPMTSIQSIAIINGRPCCWGDVPLALCHKSGLFDEATFHEWYTGTPFEDDFTAHTIVRRLGAAKPVQSDYSVAHAKRAKLWGKDTYQKFPERMLRYRARAFALRDAFADVLEGLYTAEEMGVDRALDALDLTGEVRAPMTDADITEQLTRPMEEPTAKPVLVPAVVIEPEPVPEPVKQTSPPEQPTYVPDFEPEHVVQHPAKFAPSVPPPDTEFFDTLKAQYNSMTPEQLGPIRIEKNFGMIDEYKTRSWEDQNDLMMAMRDAAKD